MVENIPNAQAVNEPSLNRDNFLSELVTHVEVWVFINL
jgi:hypothetical protein